MGEGDTGSPSKTSKKCTNGKIFFLLKCDSKKCHCSWVKAWGTACGGLPAGPPVTARRCWARGPVVPAGRVRAHLHARGVSGAPHAGLHAQQLATWLRKVWFWSVTTAPNAGQNWSFVVETFSTWKKLYYFLDHNFLLLLSLFFRFELPFPYNVQFVRVFHDNTLVWRARRDWLIKV